MLLAQLGGNGGAHCPELLARQRLLKRLDAARIGQLAQRLSRLDAPQHVRIVPELETQQLARPLEVERLNEPAALIKAHGKRTAH